MATPVWGQLSKSQVDNEKVEEAVDRIVEAHNDDPDAHLEVGQALLSHKAAVIIDHAALSIITDKLASGAVTSDKITASQIVGKDFRTAADVGSTQDGVKFDANGIEMWQGAARKVRIPISGDAEFRGRLLVDSIEYTKFMVRTNWEVIDVFGQTLTGSRGTISNGLCQLFIESGNQANDIARLQMFFDNKLTNLETDNPIIETRLFLDDIAYGDWNFALGLTFMATMEDGFGWRYDGSANKLYAYHYKDGVEYKTEVSGYTKGDRTRFRAERKSAAIWFSKDGVLEVVHSTNLPVVEIDTIVTIEQKNTRSVVADGYYEYLLFIQNT